MLLALTETTLCCLFLAGFPSIIASVLIAVGISYLPPRSRKIAGAGLATVVVGVSTWAFTDLRVVPCEDEGPVAKSVNETFYGEAAVKQIARSISPCDCENGLAVQTQD